MAKSKAKSQLAAPVVPDQGKASKRKKRAKKAVAKVASLTPYLRLLVDPWEGEMQGAQCPDTNQIPTLIWKERHAETLSTDAQGNLLQLVRTTLKSMLYSHTLDASGTSTAATARDITNYTSLSTTFTTYRPYSVGVTLKYIGQSDLEKGLFWAATTTVSPPAVGTSQAVYLDEADYEETSADNEIAAVVRLHGSAFVGVTSATPDVTDRMNVLIGCSGLPASTACVRMEVVWTGEVTLDPTQLMARSVSYSPTHPPQVHAGANIVGPKTSTASGKDARAKLVRQAEKAAALGMKINGVVQTYGPLAAEFAAMFM